MSPSLWWGRIFLCGVKESIQDSRFHVCNVVQGIEGVKCFMKIIFCGFPAFSVSYPHEHEAGNVAGVFRYLLVASCCFVEL